MAIRNSDGFAISYDCEDLISELTLDIAEFGNVDMLVIVEEKCGVDIRKDYNFANENNDIGMELTSSERVERIKAKDLLKIYEQQNSIF